MSDSVPKKQLAAAQGIEAGCILFHINTATADILRMAREARMPSHYLEGSGADIFCQEWRAFVHAVVTAGLMQHAPNSVLMAYLRQTRNLLAAAGGQPEADALPGPLSPDSFVDGPFSRYMALLAQARQAECPDMFCQRMADAAPLAGHPDAQAKARLAAMMAMLISAVWDKLEQYDILPE